MVSRVDAVGTKTLHRVDRRPPPPRRPDHPARRRGRALSRISAHLAMRVRKRRRNLSVAANHAAQVRAPWAVQCADQQPPPRDARRQRPCFFGHCKARLTGFFATGRVSLFLRKHPGAADGPKKQDG